MNEKSKQRMKDQQQAIHDGLSSTFNLPVFEDEISESELPDQLNLFFVIYGDFQKTESPYFLLQEIYVVYVSEDNANVETTTIDIISIVDKINAISFDRTSKERLQKKDSDTYIDQVTVVFKRKVAYEY